MGVRLNISGKRFNSLTAIKDVGKTSQGVYNWLCKCDCGKEKIIRVSKLTSNETKSCGCLLSISIKSRATKHGHCGRGELSGEYETWKNLKSRCGNPNNPRYHNYGGRGIKVCERWKNSFSNFYSDMGNKPSKKHSIDRIDTNGDYTPYNCRWATTTEQARNRTSNVYLDYKGGVVILKDVAAIEGVCSVNLRYHLNKGKSVSEAVSFIKNQKI